MSVMLHRLRKGNNILLNIIKNSDDFYIQYQFRIDISIIIYHDLIWFQLDMYQNHLKTKYRVVQRKFRIYSCKNFVARPCRSIQNLWFNNLWCTAIHGNLGTESLMTQVIYFQKKWGRWKYTWLKSLSTENLVVRCQIAI